MLNVFRLNVFRLNVVEPYQNRFIKNSKLYRKPFYERGIIVYTFNVAAYSEGEKQGKALDDDS